MELHIVAQHLGIALGLGLLVGLQRERSSSPLAGFRTFPLVTLLGTVCALLAVEYGGWSIGAGFISLAAIIVSGEVIRRREGHVDLGRTTDVAVLLMFGVGAYLPMGHTGIGVALGGIVAVLLYLKPQLHQFATRVGDDDFKAIMQFVLITLVILPVLPNKAYGPYQVLNPYKIWWLVVLIVGLSLAAYVFYQLLGEKAGTLAGGLLGGLISSTATSVSYARRSKSNQASAESAALVIMLASAVSAIRVLVILGAVAPGALAPAVGPLGSMLAMMLLLSGALWWGQKDGQGKRSEHRNPSELKSALVFAAIFAVVLLGVAAAQDRFGTQGLYVVGALSGLTDMDAITLSTAQMMNSDRVTVEVAWRVILIALLSNLVFKGITTALLGSRSLRRSIAIRFGITFVAGVAILLWWPST